MGIAVAASLLVISYGVVLVVNVLGSTTEERRSALRPDAGLLVIDNAAGDVTVIAGDVDSVQVVATLRYGLSAPIVASTRDASGVRLVGQCQWWGPNCSVSYDVTVPRGLAVEATSPGGDVVVRGAVGQLVLRSSAGIVRGAVLAADNVVAHSSAGDVDLSFSAAPSRVAATSSAGDVSVAVPPAAGDYRVNVDGDATSPSAPPKPATARQPLPRAPLPQRSWTDLRDTPSYRES